jgi:hypothetical protein
VTLDQAVQLLGEAVEFIEDECVENYPGERLPGSFADAAHQLVTKIKQALAEHKGEA